MHTTYKNVTALVLSIVCCCFIDSRLLYVGFAMPPFLFNQAVLRLIRRGVTSCQAQQLQGPKVP